MSISIREEPDAGVRGERQRSDAGATARVGGAQLLQGGAPVVGECVEASHPDLQGRVRVRMVPSPSGANAGGSERWVPTLQDLPVREGDRVLLVQAQNWDEPIVVGVVDGFARRPDPERREAATLDLQRDECVRVRSTNGEELIEIRRDTEGPVIRLLQEDVDLELPGALEISAEEIALRARQGRVSIRATDDVEVRGEIVRLN